MSTTVPGLVALGILSTAKPVEAGCVLSGKMDGLPWHLPADGLGSGGGSMGLHTHKAAQALCPHTQAPLLMKQRAYGVRGGGVWVEESTGLAVVTCGQPQDRGAEALRVEQERRVAGGSCLATGSS